MKESLFHKNITAFRDSFHAGDHRVLPFLASLRNIKDYRKEYSFFYIEKHQKLWFLSLLRLKDRQWIRKQGKILMISGLILSDCQKLTIDGINVQVWTQKKVASFNVDWDLITIKVQWEILRNQPSITQSDRSNLELLSQLDTNPQIWFVTDRRDFLLCNDKIFFIWWKYWDNTKIMTHPCVLWKGYPCVCLESTSLTSSLNLGGQKFILS